MNQERFINLLLEKGKSKNIEEMEVYISKRSNMDINIYEGSLEKFIIAKEETLSLRGIYDGKMGYSYTEKLAEESLEELFQNLIEYAQNNNNGTIEEITSVQDKAEPQAKSQNLSRYSQNQKIEYMLDLEKRAYDIDTRVKTISQCSYNEKAQEVLIKNTKGLALTDSHRIGVISLSAVAEENGQMKTGYSHIVFNKFQEKYKEALIRDCIGDAVVMLGAKSIEPGAKEVILRNNVAADLFSNFINIFYASTVEKGLSLMKGKLETKVAADVFNIIENPFMPGGKICRFFDDEGTPTFKKYVIEDGVLKTFLYNNKSADKQGTKSTGNAFRNSHKSSIGTMSTNMYIKEGSNSLDDLIEVMKNGVVITDIHGLHAGINSTSGDFSLSANGLLVEDGQITRPLTQITVAGNLYKMLKNIKLIGNDTKFSHPSGNYLGSPSISVGRLVISGK